MQRRGRLAKERTGSAVMHLAFNAELPVALSTVCEHYLQAHHPLGGWAVLQNLKRQARGLTWHVNQQCNMQAND